MDSIPEDNEYFDNKLRKALKMESDFPAIEAYKKMPPPYQGDDGFRQSAYTNITPIELGIINQYLYDTYIKPMEGINILTYGHIGSEGRLVFGGAFDHSGAWWFRIELEGMNTPILVQTISFMDKYDVLNTKINVTSEIKMSRDSYKEILKNLKSMAFNNSVYKGKCIEVVISGGNFRGIIESTVDDVCDNIILGRSQKRLIKHLVNRIKRGRTARVMLNGVPGAGKTETIRQIIQELTPECTFIIPVFNSVNDLKMIFETCEVFDKGVIIMDDIDLYVGTRDKGNTNMLGEFLSFFDGVQKRNINLLASTNDKSLVDDAAERPGRFNFIIDFDYLTDEQIPLVCEIHLDKKWQIKEVYDTLTGTINGTKAKVTGAFIHNLGDSLREMVVDYEEEDGVSWELEDTLALIESFYRGFYGNQNKKTGGLGFQTGR